MHVSSAEFTAFWNAFPRRVGRLAAEKAYVKARTLHGATQAELLDGIRRYVEGKPAYADYCHPVTWLNQGRWMDDYDPPAVLTTATDWWAECQQHHGGSCVKRWTHEWRMKETA